MADLPNASELHADFLDTIEEKLGAKLDRRNLSRWSVMGAGFAQMGVRSNVVVVDGFDAQTLDGSIRDGLDEYCRKRGPVERFASRKAVGTATLTRATTAAGAGEIPAGHQIRVPYNGRSFVFVVRSSKSVASSALTVSVDVEAQASGADSNVGTVSAALSLPGLPTPLWDSTLLPTSITVAGGDNAEEDEPMRERQRLYERSRQRGTKAAIAFGARLVPGVRHVVLATVNDPHLGAFANLYIGDVNWESTQSLRDEVAVSIESWRGHAPLNVRGMTQSDVTVSATIEMARPIAFYSVLQLKEAAVVAVTNFFDGRINPYEYDLTTLQGRIARVHDEVSRVTLAAPTTSVANPLSPSAYKTNGYLPVSLTRYRTSRSLVTINIEGPS